MEKYPYATFLDIRFPQLTVVDVPAVVGAVRDQWFNQTLCKVNDSVLRLGVMQGEYHWHKHDNDDELFFVLEGRVDVLFEDAWRPLGPGQFLHVPRGTLHTFRIVTTEAARMLSGFVPSGFERFFRDFGQSARLEDVEPPPVQEADIQRLYATASQYDMELGPVDSPHMHPA